MSVREIAAAIDAIGNKADLYGTDAFAAREVAINTLEFDILDRIEGLLEAGGPPGELHELKRRAEETKRRLEDLDEALFRGIRERIRTGRLADGAFKDLADRLACIDPSSGGQDREVGYDNLDILINGILHAHAFPDETKPLEPEMVYYQKTPARIVFELAGKAAFTGADVFFDLGSGLGQVAMLVNLLSGVKARGVEFEPAYCEYARARSRELNLAEVEFIHADARTADYAEGTVFFLYTPFLGAMLQAVLARLREASLSRKIRVFTYGPCTAVVAGQDWLLRMDSNGDSRSKLGIFVGRAFSDPRL